jgi:hypothetical protein
VFQRNQLPLLESILKMEGTGSSETFVTAYRIIQAVKSTDLHFYHALLFNMECKDGM